MMLSFSIRVTERITCQECDVSDRFCASLERQTELVHCESADSEIDRSSIRAYRDRSFWRGHVARNDWPLSEVRADAATKETERKKNQQHQDEGED